MAELPEGFSVVEELPEGFSVSNETTDALPEGFSVASEATEELPQGFSVVDEGPETVDVVKGVGAEVISGGVGSVAGGIIGGAIGSVVPVVGTAVGAIAGTALGGFAGGFLGSLWAQDIEGQEDVSIGRALGAATVSAIPLGGTAAKTLKGGAKITGAMVGKAAGREALKGAAMGGAEATVRTAVDEGRMPTKEEYAAYVGGGAVFGGALGAAMPKVGKSMDKFFSKTAREIDNDIASGVIEYKDLEFIVKQGAEARKKAPPPIPETRNGGQQFHGTTSDLSGGISHGSYNEQNIYGQGLYTTDAMDVAKGYSGKGSGDGSVIYSITEKSPVKFIDLDGVGARELAGEFDDEIIQEVLEELSDNASAADMYDAMRKLPYTADEIQESFLLIQEKLEAGGYGGIRHTGGKFTKQQPHNVKIYFDPKNQIDVKEHTRFDVPELTQLKRKASRLRASRRDLPFGDREADNAWRKEVNETHARIAELEKPKPSMEGVLRGQIEVIKTRAKSDAATELLFDKSPAGKMKDKFLSIVAPSKVVGKEARNEALALRKRSAAAEELGARVDRRIKKNPELQAQAADFKAGKIDVITVKDAGGKMQRHPLTDDLMVWRKKLGEYQGELAYQIDQEDLAKGNPQKLKEVTELIMNLKKELPGAPKHGSVRRKLAAAKKKQVGLEASPKLAAKIRRSKLENNFSSVEYRTFTDSDFVPDIKLRPAAVDEVAQGYVRGGLYKDTDAGRALAKVKASKHLDGLEQNSARMRKQSPQKRTGGKIDSVIKKKKKVGPAEKAWLGEITETGEQFRGTISRVGRLVAQKKTDRNLTNILVKNGLAVPSDSAPKGMLPLTLRSGDVTNMHVSPEVQASVNSLYMTGAPERSSNRMIAGLQDLYSSSVGLSKAVKVLLNPPSYAVQVFGNTTTLATMGTNPFGSLKRGTRLAFAEFGGLEHVMSTKGVKERKALLREMNDMTEYGIKGENIMESDMRDSFENGLFSKALEKPIGFFGKAYSVPDTIGRYVGWKAQQKVLKKIYPHLDDEANKRLAADMINDTYQNYDRTSAVFKRLSRMGIMPQFATFTAEFMRNQYNQAKFAKQMLSGTFGAELGVDMSKLTKAGLREMRREGATRMAAMATVYGGVAAGIDALNADGGVTEDNEQAIKEGVPSWDQHKKLAIRMSEDGKSGSYANVSYIAPQALGMAAWDAAMSDEPLDNLASMVVEEFVGEGSFVNRGLMEAINNRNDRGNKISYSEHDLVKAKELLTHFVKETFSPGISREISKMDLAMRDKGDLSVKQVLARQVGYRVNSFTLAENYKYKMMEHKENADGSARAYGKARDKGEMRPDEIEAVYQKANDARRESFAMISRSNENLKKTNHTEDERIQVMKKAGIGSRDIIDILNGTYRDLPRVKLPSTSDTYEGLPEGESAKRKAIMKIRRTDRALATRLMQRMKREKADARRGVSTQEGQMKNLDVAERARMIMDHPNPSGYLREMQRKGIATKQVVDLVRLMQRAQ